MGGYSGESRVIKQFWKLLESRMNEDEQSKLLKFVTSCPRQPLMGFGAMVPGFTISKLDCENPDSKLPTASTCFNILRLPDYSTEQILR